MSCVWREKERPRPSRLRTSNISLALALLSVNEGVAQNVLRRWRIDIHALRQSVAADSTTTPLDDLIALAHGEQRNLGHTYLGTEHLLLALLHHTNNGAARFLHEQGVDLVTARQDVLKELDPNFTSEM
jgi:ATP-dependent Clp protease ATP-binding subunit ClpC